MPISAQLQQLLNQKSQARQSLAAATAATKLEVEGVILEVEADGLHVGSAEAVLKLADVQALVDWFAALGVTASS